MLIRTILLLALVISNTPLMAGTVVVYTWADYIAPSVADRFYRDSGHVLKLVDYPSVKIRNRTLLKGRGNIDLVMMGANHIQFMQQVGKLNDISAVPFDNKKHIDPRWQKSCGPYGVPYSWGTTGIAYRSSIATTPINSWKQFFQPEPAFSGRIVYSMDEVTPVNMALMAIDASLTATKGVDLDTAVNLLRAQSEHVLAYQLGTVYAKSNRTDSKMAMTLTYSSDVAAIKQFTEQEDWVYVVPEEGTTIWVDCFVNPASRPLSPAAQAFLDFINRPDIAALNAEQIWFSTPNASALKLTSESYRLDPQLFSTPELIENSVFFSDLGREDFISRRNIARKIKESNKGREPGKEKRVEKEEKGAGGIY